MAYKVKCVEIDEDSDYDDCRCISKIGIAVKGGGTNKYTPETIHDRIKEDNDEIFIKVDGEKTFLEPAERKGTKYVRTEQNDTEEDNLLQQDPC